MDGLIFPIIMLTVTLLGGGFLLLVMKNTKKHQLIDDSTLAIQTAQQFINVQDIRDKYLYTKDGLVLMFLRINSISIDLYSKTEKNSLIRSLTAELSDIQYPFKFIAVSRPVDISPLISDHQDMLIHADDNRKELLRQEIIQMSNYALSGDIVERQFYISIWEKKEDNIEKELYKRIALLSEKFTSNGICSDILTEKEIIRLLNLVNNPSYTQIEDTEFEATIPVFEASGI